MKSFTRKTVAVLQIFHEKWYIPVLSLVFLLMTNFLFAMTGFNATDDYRTERLRMVERDIKGQGDKGQEGAGCDGQDREASVC